MISHTHQTNRHGDHVLATRVRVRPAGSAVSTRTAKRMPMTAMPTAVAWSWPLAVDPSFGYRSVAFAASGTTTFGTPGTSPALPARHLGPST